MKIIYFSDTQLGFNDENINQREMQTTQLNAIKVHIATIKGNIKTVQPALQNVGDGVVTCWKI